MRLFDEMCRSNAYMAIAINRLPKERPFPLEKVDPASVGKRLASVSDPI